MHRGTVPGNTGGTRLGDAGELGFEPTPGAGKTTAVPMRYDGAPPDNTGGMRYSSAPPDTGGALPAMLGSWLQTNPPASASQLLYRCGTAGLQLPDYR